MLSHGQSVSDNTYNKSKTATSFLLPYYKQQHPGTLSMTSKRIRLGALLFSLCATAAVQAKEWTEIRFGVFPQYPPFESVAADGSLQGFDIELGNAICTKLQVKCTWVHNEFDGMIPALRARKFDAIMSSMAVTPARLKQIAFSDRLYLSPTSVIVRKSADFGDTPESLKGKQIGVLQGSPHQRKC